MVRSDYMTWLPLTPPRYGGREGRGGREEGTGEEGRGGREEGTGERRGDRREEGRGGREGGRGDTREEGERVALKMVRSDYMTQPPLTPPRYSMPGGGGRGGEEGVGGW